MTSFSTIARRYARAFFELDRNEKTMAEVAKDMEKIITAMQRSTELRAALSNPIIPPLKKKNIVKNLFESHLSASTLNFINFLGHKKRLGLLQEIAAEVLALEKERQGIKDAALITARPLDASSQQKLLQTLSKRYQKKFNLNIKEDPSLLGGFRLQVDDRVFDFTIKNKIQRLTEIFSQPA